MLGLVTQGISLGFSAGALPGPFLSYLINTTLALGWRKSMIVILTPLLTDGPIILLAIVVLKQLSPEFIRVIQIVGGLYLIWIAFSAWRQFRTGVSLTPTEAPPQRQTLGKGMVMNWLNPGPYIFWGTITGPLLIKGLELSVWHAGAFLLAFYGTFLGFLAVYVFIFDRLRRLDERATRGVFLITIVVLLFFGLSLIGQGFGILQ